MASWNIPALINKISDDVPAIKTLLTALFKWTDADTTDVPVGAKRLEAVTGGRQIQEKTASGWASVGKLMHDADTLDGWHGAQSALANHVVVRDSNGKINGDILGNANTATTASSLAQNYVAPIANGGTGATSAANARANLGANNGSNINTGVVGTAYGGTGRTDGKVTDVHLTDYNTGAVGVGQLGSAAAKNAVSADSLVVPGVYFCTGCTTALKYPSVNDCFIRTEASGAVGGYTHLVQNLTEAASAKEYRRVSHDGGASWEGWIPVDRTESADVHIYVSKGGSDASTGLASGSAVLTKGRALDIAMGLKVRGRIVFHFGPGEWGDLTVNGGTLQCASVKIVNYPDSATATAEDYALLTDEGNYGTQPPVFGVLSLQSGVFALGNVNASEVATDGAEILPCDFFVAAAKTVSGNQIGFGFGASNAVESYAPTPAAADDSKKIANTEWVLDATEGYINGLSVSGQVITYTKGDGTTGTITTQDTNTTYSAATQSAAGLMSAGDKKKLDGINTGAGKYTLKATWTKPGNGQKTVTGCTVGKPVFFVHKGYSTNYGLWCFITDVSGTISSRSTNYHHYFLGQGLSDKIGGGPKTFTVIATATSIVVDVQNAGDDDVIYVYV